MPATIRRLVTFVLIVAGCSTGASPGSAWTSVAQPALLKHVSLNAAVGPFGLVAVGGSGNDGEVLLSSDGAGRSS
jgi:hypothetical protein